MKLVQRGGVYAVHFTDTEGNRKRVSTGERDEALARIKAVEIMREHFVDALEPADRKKVSASMTVGRALDSTYDRTWKKQKGAKEKLYTVGKIKREIGHWPLTGVSFARLQDWCSEKMDEPESRSPATMNRHLSAVHTAMTEAWQRGEIEAVPPFPSYDEDNIKERYVSDDEEAATLAWFVANTAPADVERQYMRLLYVTLLDTGMRCSEALELSAFNRRTDAAGNLTDVWLRHGSTKNGKGRVVPLTDRARASVAALMASPLHGTVDSDWAGRRWRVIRAELKMEDVGLHTLRHTCASRLVQAGVSLYVVKEWLGHSSIKVTERYAHLAPKQFDAALAALSQRTVPAPSVVPNLATVPEVDGTKEKKGRLAHPFSFDTNNLNGAPGEIRSLEHPEKSSTCR